MKAAPRYFALAGAVALYMPAIGCASNSSRVTREETVRSISPYTASAEGDGKDHRQVVETHTTVTNEEKENQGGGVISTTVTFIGEVIAFPFRLLGAVFRAIF